MQVPVSIRCAHALCFCACCAPRRARAPSPPPPRHEPQPPPRPSQPPPRPSQPPPRPSQPSPRPTAPNSAPSDALRPQTEAAGLPPAPRRPLRCRAAATSLPRMWPAAPAGCTRPVSPSSPSRASTPPPSREPACSPLHSAPLPLAAHGQTAAPSPARRRTAACALFLLLALMLQPCRAELVLATLSTLSPAL